jgi:hypothetical protein
MVCQTRPCPGTAPSTNAQRRVGPHKSFKIEVQAMLKLRAWSLVSLGYGSTARPKRSRLGTWRRWICLLALGYHAKSLLPKRGSRWHVMLSTHLHDRTNSKPKCKEFLSESLTYCWYMKKEWVWCSHVLRILFGSFSPLTFTLKFRRFIFLIPCWRHAPAPCSFAITEGTLFHNNITCEKLSICNKW